MAGLPPYALTLADLNRLLGSAAMPTSVPPTGGLFINNEILTFAPAVTLPPAGAPKGSFFIGVNLSGLENAIPTEPTLAQIQYFASIGITTFRLPTLWENWQASVGAALTPSYVAMVQDVFSNVASVGGKVMPDIHNFGSFNGGKIGGGVTTIANFVNLWHQINAIFGSYTSLFGYDLMNEWSTMPDHTVIQSAQQAVITDLRSAGYVGPILYENDDFSGAWDWTSTALKTNLYQLTDPQNNIFPSPHSYFDNDSSGGADPNGGWSYADEVAKATGGGAPQAATAGFPTGPQVGVQRAGVVVNWAATYNLNKPIFGEGIWGRDDPGWNTVGLDFLNYIQAHGCGVFLWGGTGFPASYPGCLDATTLGKQARQITLVRKFTAPNLPQPTAFYFSAGFIEGTGDWTQDGYDKPIPSRVAQGASTQLYIDYRGTLASAFQATLSATDTDGNPLSVTFTPATVTVPAGDNPLVPFTAMPNVSSTILIKATAPGFTSPAPVAISSIADLYTQLPQPACMILSTRREYTPYVGPAFTLQRDSDNAQMTFYFNAAGDLPRQAIQSWAGQRVIKIITHYDQSGNGNHFQYSQGRGYPVLTLVNAQGYPEVTFPVGALAGFDGTLNVQGQNQLTIQVRANASNPGDFIRQDYYNGPFDFSLGGLQIQDPRNTPTSNPPGAGTGLNLQISQSITLNAYHSFAFTYTANSTTGLNLYQDHVLGAQAALPNFTLQTCYDYGNDTSVQVGWFDYYGGTTYEGAYQAVRAFYTALTVSQLATLDSADATYFARTLPDTLSAVAPSIIGAGASNDVHGTSSKPFANVVISDQNSGTPKDTVTLTLSGAAGTLSGTGLTGSGPYTLAAATPANITTKLQALSFTGSGAVGAVTTIAIHVSSSAGTTADSSATVVTVVNPYGPAITGTGPSSPVVGKFNSPFSQIALNDPNTGSPTDTATIAISGSGGTLAGAGLSGSGPYTLAAATPATIQGQLQQLVFTPSGAAGAVTTLSLTVASSAGGTTVDTKTVLTNVAYQAETPYPAPSGTFTPISPASASYKGCNIMGADSGASYPAGSGYNYSYAFNGEMDYFASKGFGMIRLGLTSPRIFPVPFGLADPANRTDEPANGYRTFPSGSQTNLLSIKANLDYALTKGMRVLLDPHDYGQVWNGGTMVPAGSNYLPGQAILVDNISRLATLFKNYPNVVWSLNNEPVNAGTAASWYSTVCLMVAAIRAAGATQKIMISISAGYDAAYNAYDSQGSVWDTFNQTGWTGNNGDPQNNFVFEFHGYLDSNNDGVTDNVKSTGWGSQVLVEATHFCKQTSAGVNRSVPFQAFLGEFGAFPDSTMQTELANELTYMSNNSGTWMGWTYFTGGSLLFYGSYNAGLLCPGGYPNGLQSDHTLTAAELSALTDQQDMALLKAHL